MWVTVALTGASTKNSPTICVLHVRFVLFAVSPAPKVKLRTITLADHAQLSRNQISLIELGKIAPTIWSLERLAVALGRRPHELLRAAEDRRG